MAVSTSKHVWLIFRGPPLNRIHAMTASPSSPITATGGGLGGGAMSGPDGRGGTVALRYGPDVSTARGYGFKIQQDFTATALLSSQTAKDGSTTHKLQTEISIGFSGGIQVPAAGAEVRWSNGRSATYEITLPARKSGQPSVDPLTVSAFAPSTLPVGASVKIDQSGFTKTEMQATFRGIALQTDQSQSQGNSLLVQKIGPDLVRVTTGPTSAIDALNAVGVSIGEASAVLGRADSIKQATLCSATFDLGTPEGRKAYGAAMNSGKLPDAPAKGVSDIERIRKLDVESSTALRARFQDNEWSAKLASNSGSSVYSFRPDGSVQRTTSLQYGGANGLQIEQRFDAHGRENPNARAYTISIKVDNAFVAQNLNEMRGKQSLTGDAAVKVGQTVQFQLTEAQMRNLMAAADRSYDALPGAAKGASPIGMLLYSDANRTQLVQPQDFAIGLARSIVNTPERTSDLLRLIADGADGKHDGLASTELPGKMMSGPQR